MILTLLVYRVGTGQMVRKVSWGPRFKFKGCLAFCFGVIPSVLSDK